MSLVTYIIVFEILLLQISIKMIITAYEHNEMLGIIASLGLIIVSGAEAVVGLTLHTSESNV